MKISCNVIRDLLPLYEDGAVSEDTAELVREHLKDCPDCREELRKLRTPISVPPEEDGELWERFEARREKQRRKRRIWIACALSLLAAAVAFCFWYMWPRSWEKLTGPDSREVTSLSCCLSTIRYETQEDGKVDTGFDFWIVQGEQAMGTPTDAVLGAFKSFSYRKSLQNLIPRDSWDGTADYVQAGIVWDYAGYKSVHVSSDGRVLFEHKLYYTNKELYDELARLVREYGTLQE